MPTSTQLVSALADSQRLRLFARIVDAGGTGVAVSAVTADDRTTGKQLAKLVQAGLVERREDGTCTARGEVFREALDEASAATSGGGDQSLERLFSGGRLKEVPRKRDLRRRLLRYLAATSFSPDSVYSEKQVNSVLGECHPDYSTLRRYLVDEGFLARSDDGREYRVAPAP